MATAVVGGVCISKVVGPSCPSVAAGQRKSYVQHEWPTFRVPVMARLPSSVASGGGGTSRLAARQQVRMADRRDTSRHLVRCSTGEATEEKEASATIAPLDSCPMVDLRTDGAVQTLPSQAGVYAVYDPSMTLQFVGITRRINGSVNTHVNDWPEDAAFVRFAVLGDASRQQLQEGWKEWISQHVAASGAVPEGNVSGNTKWTERRVKPQRPELRILPGSHVSLTVPIETVLQKMVDEVPVLAFIKGTRTAPQCGFSQRLLSMLNEYGVEFDTINVLDEEHNPGLREAIKTFSQWPTIPQLYAHGNFVGGCDIVTDLHGNGELRELLKKP